MRILAHIICCCKGGWDLKVNHWQIIMLTTITLLTDIP